MTIHYKILILLVLSIGSSAYSFPALIPSVKPSGKISPAIERLYDEWNPHEDRANELYSNFKYSAIQGLECKPNISRRDPTKVLLIDGVYHVWYTCRKGDSVPVGGKLADDITPSFDWDLCDIWHATSRDGWTWVEDKVPAVKRLPKPQNGWRSISTPDILIWNKKYYLYYQAFNEIPGKNVADRAAVTVAESDSPYGPWKPSGKMIINFGKSADWDSNAIHDPYPIVYKNKIYLYYKGSPQKGGSDGTIIRAQGVAIADDPYGPFVKSSLNPVINSGHETCMFPWKSGIAAIVSLDGAEKNTIQYAPDGINFSVKSIIQIPPVAPGPFVADAFSDNGNGRGITWGLAHVMDKESGANNSELIRFDCDLSLDVDRPIFKRNNLRFNKETYFQKTMLMPRYLKTEERYR